MVGNETEQHKMLKKEFKQAKESQQKKDENDVYTFFDVSGCVLMRFDVF